MHKQEQLTAKFHGTEPQQGRVHTGFRGLRQKAQDLRQCLTATVTDVATAAGATTTTAATKYYEHDGNDDAYCYNYEGYRVQVLGARRCGSIFSLGFIAWLFDSRYGRDRPGRRLLLKARKVL